MTGSTPEFRTAVSMDDVERWVLATCPGTQTGPYEMADRFFFPGDQHMFPYATIVTQDYPGDERSRLNRPGVFRLNIGVRPATFRQLFPDGDDPGADRSVPDVLFPHPVYGAQFWLSVINPSRATLDELTPLLREARDQQATRDARGSGRQD
ncbi:MAG TPA: DUF6194 family protein [Thermomicrobiales bacterium]|nr:DUF6194 family protein [Thermomicrobiales bacterium]